MQQSPTQQLPDDVLVGILVRLPARYIARCHAVCRAWRSAISHPTFHRAHAKRPAAVAQVAARHQIQYRDVQVTGSLASHVTRAVFFDFFFFPGGARRHRENNVRRRRAPPFPRALWFTTSTLYAAVVGSWDGVVCLARGKRPFMNPDLHVKEYVLWNPLTMACATVDVPAGHPGYIIGGFAHPETRRFHLLHASYKSEGDFRLCPAVFRIRRVGDDAVWRELPFPEEDSSSPDAAGTEPPEFFMHVRRFVRLHDKLHWLARRSSGSTRPLQLFVFDTAREKFWSMAAPERRGRPGYLSMSRVGVLSGGTKLCVFFVERSSSTMEVWVLDGYSGSPRSRGTWRLDATISMVTFTWNRFDLSQAFYDGTEVDVAEHVRDGEEVVLTLAGGLSQIAAYNVRRKVWRLVDVPWSTFMSDPSIVTHRESVLGGGVSFGRASRAPSVMLDYYGQRCYCL